MRFYSLCLIGLLWMPGGLAFGKTPADSSRMLLSIYHSNDLMGYLTPCG
ncbi:MAG TPA: hypothetical protein PK843_01515 [bacterium]|nr:hypothetical protein [bacterium]HPN33166.1 hypothetical protein [bacterium]